VLEQVGAYWGMRREQTSCRESNFCRAASHADWPPRCRVAALPEPLCRSHYDNWIGVVK